MCAEDAAGAEGRGAARPLGFSATPRVWADAPRAPPQAEAAVAALRVDNEKLRYRVGHLVRSLREADAQRPPPPPPPLERFSTTPFDYKSPLKAGGAAAPPATP